MESPPLDPQYKGHWGPSIIGILAGLNALVVIVTILRVITRLYIVNSFWWDDLTIVLATVSRSCLPQFLLGSLHKQDTILTRPAPHSSAQPLVAPSAASK